MPTESEDYTRDEALAVAEASSLRELVAETFAARVRATNFEAVVMAIRLWHRREGAPSRGWLCVKDKDLDRRCRICRAIDKARKSATILKPDLEGLLDAD